MSATLPESGQRDPIAGPSRLVSLDTYRGAVMLLMASNGLQFAKVARHFPDSGVWQFLAMEADHVRWQGCHLWDLIMPAFMLMVGVSVPYSIASRRRRGQGSGRLLAHAIWRSVALVVIGVLLHLYGEGNFNFINVLAQIGLGYTIVFLIAQRPVREQVFSIIVILVGYWYLFYSYPLPDPSFDFKSVGVPQDWHHLEGVAAHWDLNTNPATAADQWLLNLFPREKPFVYRRGGGGTINFVPAIATMLLGVVAGNWLRSERTAGQKVRGMVGAGALLMIAGIALDPAILPGVETFRWSLCPIIKCLWTPSYALYSGGWAILVLALLYWIVDVRGLRRWTFPFVVVGMNSIVMYLMAWFVAGRVRHGLYALVGQSAFETSYGPIVEQLAVLASMWLVCLALYRQRVFVRI